MRAEVIKGQKARKSAPYRLQALSLFIATASLVSMSLMADGALAAKDPKPVPEGLKGVAIPTPSNLNEFVLDKAAAIRLGKALFWDTQVGSDGKTACGSCHFHAGADNRSRNQVTPGLLRLSSPGNPNPDTTFQLGGPNYQFKVDDFPFHKFSDPKKRDSSVLRSHNDAASSQGVHKSWLVGVTPGATADLFNLAGDPVFQINGQQTRQVEERNTPTMINSIFNFRNFWDGRATFLFNGASPFGAMDAGAKVYKTSTTAPTTASATTVRIDHASLASLATGPVLSSFEMSAAGRVWPQVGVRLLPARPLVQQAVSSTDGVLSGQRHSTGIGLNGTYQSMVQAAFKPEWWQGSNSITIGTTTYSQAQANFSLFFGLAVQLYGATLVSDDSPFDRHMAGDNKVLSTDAKRGMGVFFGKGKCAECHGGAEFTNASVSNVKKQPLSRMTMGNSATAVYDEGFYNTAVTKTLEDIANGGKNSVGRPIALTALAQQVGSVEFQRLIGISANLTVSASERIAVKGAFKTSGLRNVELTAPYFHNGDSLTLEQVVEFYNRGGNHFKNNLADVDADIEPLGLDKDEQANLVQFMKALTDDRVRYKRAPFDHPQIKVPNGVVLDAAGLPVYEAGRAKDSFLDIAAVGRDGLNVAPANFLEKRELASAPGPTALPCANEGKNCKIPKDKTGTVWYGAGTGWIALSGVVKSIECTSTAFSGDPRVGVVKTCMMAVD